MTSYCFWLSFPINCVIDFLNFLTRCNLFRSIFAWSCPKRWFQQKHLIQERNKLGKVRVELWSCRRGSLILLATLPSKTRNVLIAAITCPDQGSIRNGAILCSRDNDYTSQCEFHCKNEDYLRHPPNVTSNKCLITGNWSRPKPCCTSE